MLRLVVKNFGVLKDIDIELNKTNLFIGENGSGKSVLAKLITVVTNRTLSKDEILKMFDEFKINFITDDTFIQLKYNNKDSFIIIENSSIELNLEYIRAVKDLSQHCEVTKKAFIDDITANESKYIPAERNLIALLNKSIYSLLTSDIPLPKELLNFGSQYEKAKNEIPELDLLEVKFKTENGVDKIYYNKNEFLPLENSSSGIQSALPLYLTIKYFNLKHNNIIIEEPEQNLYPKAQVDTIKFIIENSSENLYLMTHSPYVLSTLNILIFAYKASNTNDILKDKISKIIPLEQQINPDELSAYLIENGTVKSIKGKSTGMIKENVIDDVGDMIDDEFSELMELYREFKND